MSCIIKIIKKNILGNKMRKSYDDLFSMYVRFISNLKLLFYEVIVYLARERFYLLQEKLMVRIRVNSRKDSIP